MPAVHIPSLSVLRCFEAAAKYQSHSAAAEDLGVTQSSISRQVKELEAFIGTALFRREGRGVRLTEAGEALAAELTDDLERLRQTLSHAVAAGAGPKAFVIAAPPTFAARWMVPRLPQFQKRHPETQVVIYSRSEPFDLIAEKVDLAIHCGTGDWPAGQLSPLCPEDLVVVAAPGLVGASAPLEPAEIVHLPLLHLTSRRDMWSSFSASHGMEAEARHGATFDQFSLVIAAALAQLGVAILPTYLIERELAEEKLVVLCSASGVRAQSYFVATPAGQNTALASEFTIWLRSQVRNRS